jgi:1,4-dihydroxy-2-naphthoate octaprenyltransferase
LMSFLLVSLGTAVAAHEGHFNLTYYLLAVIGVTLTQNAVNVLNDYHDFKTGVDAQTPKTPFSGGSKYLVTGMIKPESARLFGVTSLLLAVSIGFFFIMMKGAGLLSILAVAAVSVYFYTSIFARTYLGEFLAGLNLGPLAVIGSYFVQTGTFGAGAVAVGVAPGIMIFNVLFLNEFPDIEADSSGGRRNLPILLGRKRAAYLYAILETLALFWVAISALVGLTAVPTLIALASAPFAARAISILLREPHSAPKRIIPALGANILTAYITIALLGVGYVISVFVRI